jgi:cytochrome d ubiquinol oxidase subunit I
VGRQPWVIEGVLPTSLAVSSLSPGSVLTTLLGFIALYSALFVLDVFLMTRAIRQGPAPALSERETTSGLAAAAAAE